MSRSLTRTEYPPQLERNLRTRLVNRFRDKYRFMGGEEIIEFIVDDILGQVEQEYRSMDAMRKGQILWDGIAIKQKRKPGRALSMKETRTKPVVLSLITEEDIRKLKDGGSFRELRKDVLERVTMEAFEQGTVLNQVDLGLLVTSSPRTLRKYILELESEKQVQLPTRGRIHDLGPGVTHKRETVSMIHERYSILEISRRTSHSTEAIERFHRDYNRVEMLESKLSLEEIAFVTGMSKRLVNEYIELTRELCDPLPSGG
jgi:hypothetical protein